VPPRPWRLRIEDILEACTRIRTYTDTMDLDAFAKDQRTVDAVVRNLEIIGEAASSVPEDIQLRYGDLPWAEMRAMRNLLSHAYFLVDLDIVWKTIQDDLPQIVPALQRILDEMS
jgi:uncharacterized protein with HEPN domain